MFNTSGLDELFQILNLLKGLKGIKLRQPQWSNTTIRMSKKPVVLLHCGCLSLIPFNPFNKFRIWNNSSSPDVLNVQASISISPNYVSKSKTTSHCQLLLHDCTNAAI